MRFFFLQLLKSKWSTLVGQRVLGEVGCWLHVMWKSALSKQVNAA